MPVIQKLGDSFELRDQPIHLVGGFRRFAADAAHVQPVFPQAS